MSKNKKKKRKIEKEKYHNDKFTQSHYMITSERESLYDKFTESHRYLRLQKTTQSKLLLLFLYMNLIF